ncbi:MAG: nucleotidyltransferase domain-containing protein [Candidatus Margulisbacteria bacterium]|jgi:predicted nucleotidyltransferase|nr:nucleotidyltransferase domain-containing protein [Candidatus Margulisiibacteriota bacterium]
MMSNTAQYLQLLREFKCRHAAEYNIRRIGIFGSVARGEQTDNSDLDIYYEGPALTLSQNVRFLEELENLFDVPVDVVRKHKNLKPHFIQRIEREVLYA